MKLRIQNSDRNTALVYSPYNADFIAEIKKIGSARWQPEEKAWRVPQAEIANVRRAMLEAYGETDEPYAGKRYTVRITFLDSYEVTRSAVRLFGRDIFMASGRDSGAWPCNDVTVEAGGADSGGSMKYWKTQVKRGTVVRVTGVNEAMLEQDKDGGSLYAVEVLECRENDGLSESDRATLLEERERLERRLAEINKLLATSEQAAA